MLEVCNDIAHISLMNTCIARFPKVVVSSAFLARDTGPWQLILVVLMFWRQRVMSLNDIFLLSSTSL
jgi:hypothetical protein